MNEYRFSASGVSYHRDAVVSIARRKRDYWELSDTQLAGMYPDSEKRVYAYGFPVVTCELVPEPDNPHDPNAIRVVVDGRHVGYVPAAECAAVRSILRRAESIRAAVGKGPCKVVSAGDVRHYDDEFTVRVAITYDGAPVTRSTGTRSSGARGGKANAPVILQWVAAGLLLIFALAMLPSFAFVPFLLAAVLAAPFRPLRDLLARYRIRPWMIAAAVVVLAVLGFIVTPGR